MLHFLWYCFIFIPFLESEWLFLQQFTLGFKLLCAFFIWKLSLETLISKSSPVIGSLTPLEIWWKLRNPFLGKCTYKQNFESVSQRIYCLLSQVKCLVPHFKLLEIEDSVLSMNIILYCEEFIECLKYLILVS